MVCYLKTANFTNVALFSLYIKQSEQQGCNIHSFLLLFVLLIGCEISGFESKYCANTRGASHSANAPTKKMEIIFFIEQLLFLNIFTTFLDFKYVGLFSCFC